MTGPAALEPYRVALLDWLACAAAGGSEPATRAARAAGEGLLERVAAAGCAGHILDYDDTYTPGLVHASAAAAPAALLLGAELALELREVLEAYAAGFEAAAGLARAGHPALYERGWHPTAVCGSVGAAVGAARLLGLEGEQAKSAAALALLRASGLRAAFGSMGKALQVGGAAAAGVHAAQLALAGAEASLETVVTGPGGFEQAFGGRWPSAGILAFDEGWGDAEPLAAPAGGPRAVDDNWIKAHPCCLGTHAPIEAALALRGEEIPARLTVVVHPVAHQAAALGDVADGLQAKFSIPYLTAYTLLHGAPAPADFQAVDQPARELARERVAVAEDRSLGEMEARIDVAGTAVAHVSAPLGSPANPMDAQRLREKVRALAGSHLDGVLDDLSAPAAGAVDAAALG